MHLLPLCLLLATLQAEPIPSESQSIFPEENLVLTFHLKFFGSLRTTAKVLPSPDGNRIQGRPGATEVIGGMPSFFAGIPGSGLGKDGSLFSGKAGMVGDDTIMVDLQSPLGRIFGISPSWQGPYQLSREGWGSYSPGDLEIALTDGNLSWPSYERLARQMEVYLKEYFFDPEVWQSEKGKEYLRRIQRLGKKARDDVEFVLGVASASRDLGISHLGVVRKYRGKSPLDLMFGPSEPKEWIYVNWDEEFPVFRIPSFAGLYNLCHSIDKAFTLLKEKNPRGFVLDLRGNGGGTFMSMRIAEHLLGKKTSGGTLIFPKGREDAFAGRLSSFPTAHLSDGRDGMLVLWPDGKKATFDLTQSFEKLMDRLFSLRKDGGLRFVVTPQEEIYQGKIAVLIDGRSGSATEPVAAILKEEGRARLFGETTAGKMLSAHFMELGDGFLFRFPLGDYLTGQGSRLEGPGVEPHVPCPPDQSLEKALEWLQKETAN